MGTDCVGGVGGHASSGVGCGGLELGWGGLDTVELVWCALLWSSNGRTFQIVICVDMMTIEVPA